MKLENIDNDWSIFCEKMNITNTYLERRNATYRSIVIPPPHICKLVYKIYKSDYIHFGYGLEPHSNSKKLSSSLRYLLTQ